MKIAIINSYIGWGGLGQYSITLAEGLRNAGFDIYGLLSHAAGECFNAFSDNTLVTRDFSQSGRAIKYLQMARYLWQLKPDFIVINYNGPAHFILPCCPQCTVISIIHSDQADFYRIAKINHRYVTAWVAPTSRVNQGFKDFAQDNEVAIRVYTIPHGVAISEYPPRMVNLGVFNLVFIGALYAHKGIDMLPHILSRFLTACPVSHLTIIGGGDLADELQVAFRQAD